MKITKLQLKNFKRFTDLAIKNVPTDARLVLLIGTNGSGKSSVFDAFNLLKQQSLTNFREGDFDLEKNLDFYHRKKNDKIEILVDYYKKNASKNIHVSYGVKGSEDVTMSWGGESLEVNDFYGRSSLRQIPRLTRTRIGEDNISIRNDDDSPKLFILRDNRFENDIDNIAGNILAEVFKGGSIDTAEIRQKYIAPINRALTNIFSHSKNNTLELVSLSPPLEQKPAQLIFKKGNTDFHYDLLSSGEKEIINILLNLLSRQEYFQDTIYYIDEMDVHLNTSLQYSLLKEITENWIPPTSQLWTASHSLGFIDYAQESEHAVIIDFDDLNFDEPQILVPEPKENFEVYEIAVSKDVVNKIFEGITMFFVENKDDQYYNSVGITNTIFVPERNKSAVYYKTINHGFQGVIDRDFLSLPEIKDLESIYPTLKVLPVYSIENYLYHPDNLLEYCDTNDIDFDRAEYVAGLVIEKNRVLESLQYELAGIRESYPFFKEPNLNKEEQKLSKRYKKGSENIKFTTLIGKALRSDKLEDFYPLFPMKTYAKALPARRNITKNTLTKMAWFKAQIEQFISK